MYSRVAIQQQSCSNKWRPLVNEHTSSATYGIIKEPSAISQKSKKLKILQYTPDTVATPGECCYFAALLCHCFVVFNLLPTQQTPCFVPGPAT